MPRLPKIRVSYTSDAQFLLRLMHAIELDHKRPLPWRKKMIAQVKDLAHEFMQAPSAKESA